MCKQCAKVNGKKKMAKRRRRISGLNTKGLMATAQNDILPIAGGYFAADFISTKVTNATYVKYKRWVHLLGGAIIAGTQKGIVQKLGIGIAANGVVETVSDAMAGRGLGLLPPGQPMYRLSGLEGGAPGVPATRTAQTRENVVNVN